MHRRTRKRCELTATARRQGGHEHQKAVLAIIRRDRRTSRRTLVAENRNIETRLLVAGSRCKLGGPPGSQLLTSDACRTTHRQTRTLDDGDGGAVSLVTSTVPAPGPPQPNVPPTAASTAAPKEAPPRILIGYQPV
jgi:hypothetical protein